MTQADFVVVAADIDTHAEVAFRNAFGRTGQPPDGRDDPIDGFGGVGSGGRVFANAGSSASSEDGADAVTGAVHGGRVGRAL